jgi:hypothetical protein
MKFIFKSFLPLCLYIFLSNGQTPSGPPKADPTAPSDDQSLAFNTAVGFLVNVLQKLTCNKNVAANWLRASFHDAFTFNATDGSGGNDGSILNELDFPGSRGLQILPSIGGLNTADIVQLGAMVSVKTCGGPSIPFQMGRINALPGFQNNLSNIPNAFFTWKKLEKTYANMGLNTVDMVTLTTGSHTLGGAHRAFTPKVFAKVPSHVTFLPFDNTPGVFDNNIFVKLKKNSSDCVLPIDCVLFNDKRTRPIAMK